jgi:hypothetical protein
MIEAAVINVAVVKIVVTEAAAVDDRPAMRDVGVMIIDD